MCEQCENGKQKKKEIGKVLDERFEEYEGIKGEPPKYKYKDYTNRKFGRLTVLGLDHIQQKYKPNGRLNGHRYYYKCLCACGNTCVVLIDHLVSGKILSCNCLHKERASLVHIRHGKTKTRIFKIWFKMIQRCNNPNLKKYELWGGRGIKVCKEWEEDFLNFYNWAISNGYKDNLSIDRIDNNGNYEPLNCRWATAKEQARNTRTNVNLIYNGETHCISEWAEITGIKVGTIRYRIRVAKWSVEEALTIPVGCKRIPK